MARKLASVVRVAEILPIANADAIELARIAGWQCVVKKNEFKAGDFGVYLEIDAVPPDSDRFRWLWTPKAHSGEPVARPANYRIRTMRLRGSLSQGLLLSLAQLGFGGLDEGTDLTERMGVTKWEPPAPADNGSYRAPFPSIVPKTDETRVQSAPQVLDELRDKPFVATVKMDGTSATYLRIDGELHACSRNLSILEGDNFYWHIARRYKLAEILAAHPTLAIQGEIVGPGIQKNPVGLKDKDFFVFSLYDVAKASFLPDAALRDFCLSTGLQPVPLAFEGDAFDETVASLLAKAEGKYDGTRNEREGIVIRPRGEDLFSPTLNGRLSFKAISNAFLLGEKD